MHIGFAVFCYFPFGGLQRDMMAIAQACHQRGHQVSIFTHSWEGEQPEWAQLHLLKVRGLSNHARDQHFIAAMTALLPQLALDGLVGFNKMPGLDVYYAADSCFASKLYEERSFWYRFTPRARFFEAMEKAVFSEGKSSARILLISEAERERFRRYYGTADERMRLLPPGIRPDRRMPADYSQQRRKLRAQWLNPGDKMLLFIGSGFKTKGLDRAIRALANITAHKTRLLVIGDDNSLPYLRLAEKLNVADRVQFLGGRNDIEQFLWAGDLLVHPAYRENTGTVLLEAMVAGLPVLTTAACGYAHYVESWDMGVVLPLPYDQLAFEQSLNDLIGRGGGQWRERGMVFAESADIYSLVDHAVNEIENRLNEKYSQ